MFFKLSSRNPFRDFIRNARRIHSMKITDTEKTSAYRELYKLLSPRLHENERFLNAQPAFSKRCEHWNQRDVTGIRPVTNANNPWIVFKREFEQAINGWSREAPNDVSRALAWFSNNQYVEDWIND